MGSLLSVEKPPPVVLVPPLFHRPELASRYRMAESSYDVLFGKVARKALFGDYYTETDNLFARIMLKPPEDRNVDFIATFSGSSEEGKNFNGEAIFRWQPNAIDANTFMELNMSTWTKSLRLRTCSFLPYMGLGTFCSFSVLPLIRHSKDNVFGFRYGSSNVSVGTMVNPVSGGPVSVWFVGKMGKTTAGCQFKSNQLSQSSWNTCKECTLHELGKPQNWSFAVDYGSGARGPLSPSFNFCLEAQDNSKLIASYYHHIVVQRQVRNPLEGTDVIAITNYIDVGFEFQQSFGDSVSNSEIVGNELPAMQLGASWQANKNILLKAKLGNAISAFALSLKSWWQPSFTISFSAARDHRRKDTRFGLGVQVENFGGASYERADPTYVMVTPTKQHVAEEMMRKNPDARPMLNTNINLDNNSAIPPEFRPRDTIL